jgi:tetratricopeptide (TPR) repeat protein
VIKQFVLFLGPARSRSLFVLIAATGLLSLMLNVVSSAGSWVQATQSVLVLVALVGAAVIIGGRMDSAARSRWLALGLPALGAVALGLTVLPQFLLPLLGAALGWIVAGLFLFRSRAPAELQRAVKHLRKGEYAEAVKEVDALIKMQPDEPNHYRFRAQVLRLWGKLDRARRDYRKVIELMPDSAVGYNDMAELALQTGDLRAAHEAAQKALEYAPDDWVVLYNLGMIEDRLEQSDGVIAHLEQALALKVNDARHRALMYFYLSRAYARKGDMAAAGEALEKLKRQRGGLEEWEKILENDTAAVLRETMGADIAAAVRLAAGEQDLATLAEGAKA